MTYTGFRIRWREESSPSWQSSMVTGNVTTTTVRGLWPDVRYTFGVSGLNEDQGDDAWWDVRDLYGRREELGDALEGPTSVISGRTLARDVGFDYFDASSTQSYGPKDGRGTLGPTGVSSGEGHFGLVLVGDANVEGCNASSYCCDGFDRTTGTCGGGGDGDEAFTCRATAYRIEASVAELPGAGKIVERHNESYFSAANHFDRACGPALRLTGSAAGLRGAAWYPRELEVGEGFDTSFTFRLSNPSFR